MNKVINVDTIGHIDFRSSVRSIFGEGKGSYEESKKKRIRRKEMREHSFRQKRLDKIKDKISNE